MQIRNGAIIRYMWEKLKSFLVDDSLFTALLLCCIAVVAFLLGRQSIMINQSLPSLTAAPSVRLQTATPITTVASVPLPSTTTNLTATYVASKSGTKYHLHTCPGASQIKEENKIFFATAVEAEAAGYSKASNCPGL